MNWSGNSEAIRHIPYSASLFSSKKCLYIRIWCGSMSDQCMFVPFKNWEGCHREAHGTVHKHGQWVWSNCIRAVEYCASDTDQPWPHTAVLFQPGSCLLSTSLELGLVQDLSPAGSPLKMALNMLLMSSIWCSPGSRTACLVNHLSTKPDITSFQLSASKFPEQECCFLIQGEALMSSHNYHPQSTV